LQSKIFQFQTSPGVDTKLGGSKNPGQNKYIYYFTTFPYLPVIYFYSFTGKGGFLRIQKNTAKYKSHYNNAK
ncbi:MAG: hypothetical protein Q8K66_15420, partial [Sediminibacterium sp.]|nr:hypothetical protein [Sediminibacterium sp.]MDP3129680.1 hypothetical protein [Sediminibacterium sp.]